MNYPLAISFLFAVGAMGGWVIEFFYRNLISHNGPRGKYFINPGFCRGPWLPIYGIGVSVMFLICWLVTKDMTEITVGTKIMVILLITVLMTLIEFLGGLFLLKVMNMRLWDYRNEPGNIMGIICPKFTLIWGALGAAYFLFLHDWAIVGPIWLSYNLAFSFFIGAFASAFVIDLITSAKDAATVKQFGDEHDIVVKYEELKALVQKKMQEQENAPQKFFVQVKSEGQTLKDVLQEQTEAHEAKAESFKSKYREKRASRRERRKNAKK